MEKVLLHTCCGPCAGGAVAHLKEMGYAVTLLFANANIATPEEFERRLEAARMLADFMNLPLLIDKPDHDEWLRTIKGWESELEGGARCPVCFRYSLQRAFVLMNMAECDYFTTSLAISPLKNFAAIAAIGEEIGGSRFLPINFRKNNGFQTSVQISKEIGMYRQNYCGCEFSLRPRQQPA
jgi:hypothetical protein